jgi:hypothetical protein
VGDVRRVGDVVEPVARVVGRQQHVDLHLAREILEASRSRAAFCTPVRLGRCRAADPGVRVGGGRAIELPFEPARDGVVGRCVGSGPTGRRHCGGPQLADHLLPNLGMGADVLKVDAVERERTCFQSLVVTADAIALQGLLDRRRSGSRRP